MKLNIAAERILIYIEWSLFGYFLFFMMNLFLIEVVAFALALLITVGAFFHPRNNSQLQKLKRPKWEIEKNV